MKEIVIIDIDNTLINGYSQQMLLKYMRSKGFLDILSYFKIYLWFILYKLNFIKNPKNLMEYSYGFLNDWDVSKFESIIDKFFNEELKNRIYPEMKEIIENHKSQNRNLIIISTTIELIVKKIAQYLNIENYIGTQLETNNGKFNGKIAGDIVYKKNKNILLENYLRKNKMTLENSWAYGDHYSDLSLLEIVSNPIAVNPDQKLYQEAKKRNWKILFFAK